MARMCEICGKGPRTGNNVSHANNRTKRIFAVNLQSVRALVNGATRRLRICTRCIRTGHFKKAV